MGTLTANQTRLPEYCEHKLPTSCRLSSIPNCCACADERAHAASYSTYIDGIGFVLRGTRWQRYCWFCKEFWEERVRVSGSRSGQTKIPESPDQTDFLKKWYEFHQGYRIVVKDDGSEERVAVLGENFKDVSPGCLPRTLEELRSGRRREDGQQVQSSPARQQQESGPSLDETLEQMFAAVSAESNDTTTEPGTTAARPALASNSAAQESASASYASNIHAQAMTAAGSRSREYQMRRVAALRRELNRMRNGIERVITGLRDLGEDVPNESETTGRLTALGDTLDNINGGTSGEEARNAMNSVNELTQSATTQTSTDNTLAQIQARVDDARTAMEEARRARDQAASELDYAEQEFRTSQHRFHQVQREQRSTENYMRIFGTREEVIAQGENYVSPIGNMFSRAEERFRAAEQVRREERTLRHVLADEARTGNEDVVRRLSELEDRRRDVWGVPHPEQLRQSVPDIAVPTTIDDIETPPTLLPTANESQLEEYYAMLRRQDQQQAATNLHATASPSAVDDVNQRPNNNFPQNMLAAIVAARERELTAHVVQHEEAIEAVILQEHEAPAEVAPDDPFPEPHVDPEEWWHQDAQHIIRALTTDDALRDEVGMTPQNASVLLAYFVDDVLPEQDRMTIDGLMRNSAVIWRTGLPAEWVKRRRDAHPTSDFLFFTGRELPSTDWVEHYNSYMRVEAVAQAFQMSASIRNLASSLSPPQRLQMLYRLQAGRRDDSDINVLSEMASEEIIRIQALRTYRTILSPLEQEVENRGMTSTLEANRQAMARNGDHSRTELETRRRDTTQAFALAAGRQAMQEGSQALFERLADQNEGERAAWRRLESNGFLGNGRARIVMSRRARLAAGDLSDSDTHTDSDSDREVAEPEPRGLDALDTGRPDPKADEELTLQMGCNICYTQVADIACLPCGHLVMCKWCSEQHSPTMQHDRTRPRRAAACPVCRKGIRQKVRVFRP